MAQSLTDPKTFPREFILPKATSYCATDSFITQLTLAKTERKYPDWRIFEAVIVIIIGYLAETLKINNWHLKTKWCTYKVMTYTAYVQYIITSANSQWTKNTRHTYCFIKAWQIQYNKHEDIQYSLFSRSHTHFACWKLQRGRETYLLQGGKEWRRKVKKEKKKKNQELYYQAKRKVDTESKEWVLGEYLI